MANRDIVYGIRITANSASAVAETQKVDKAFSEVGAALSKVVVEAEKAEAALVDVVSPVAQSGLQAEASALGATVEQLDRVTAGAGKAEAALSGVTSKPLQGGVQAGAAALGETAQKLDQIALSAGKTEAALTGVASKSAQAASPAGAASLGATATQLDRVGVSAGQTAQALRQLPMQFSDIVVSLQAGQSPMQVLLQQGSQIKDQFGGIGPAAQAMGGYIAGLVGPLTIAATAVAGLAIAYYQGSEESSRFSTGLIMTGNVVGMTVSQLNTLAQTVSTASRATQAFSAEALSQVVSTGVIAAENIGMVTEAAVRMERATGQSVGETIKQFVELGKEPVKASEKLNEAANYLTTDLHKQIKALADHGKASEAAALAQKGWADALNERTGQITQNLGYIEAAWRGVIDTAKAGWDAILGVGRTQSKGDRIAELEQKAAPGRGIFAGLSADEKTELAGLKAIVVEEQKAAKAAADRAASTAAIIAWRKEVGETPSKDVLREQAIARAREKGLAAKVSEAEIEKRIAAIREKYKAPVERKTPKSPGESIEKDWIRRVAVLQAESGATTQLSETEKAAIKVMTEFAQGRLKLTAAEKARLPGLVQEALLLDDAAEAAKKAKAEQEALTKAQEEAITAARADTQALLAKLDAAQFEAETYGMTEEAVYRLLAARTADRAEMNAFGDANDAVIAELKAQEKAYLDLADAAGAKAGREAQRKAGEDARAAAQRFSDDLERALTDSLMRSFEAGKGFGESFLDSIKNMLKTAALKAVVQVILSPITGGISGVAGAGMSSSMSGGSGLMGAASNINTLSSLAGYGAIGYQWATGSMSAGNAVGTVAANATGSGLDGLIASTNGWGTVAEGTGGTAAGMSGLGLAGGAAAGALLGYQLTDGNAIGTFAGGAGGIAAYGAGASAMAGGSLAAGASAALAAVPVWGWIALAALAIGGSMATGGTPHLGGAYAAGTDGTGFKATDANYGNFGLGWGAYNSDRNAGMDGATKSLAEGIAGSLSGILGKFGLDNYYQVGVRFASDGEDASPGAIRITNQAGEIVAEVAGKFDEEASKGLEQLANRAGEAIQKTLLDADLPAWAEDTLKALGDNPSIGQLNSALASISQFEAAAGAITRTLGISTEAVYGLTKAFGGLSAAGAALGNYYQLFYSDAERTADAQAQLSEQIEALGVVMPNSKAGFRALVESIDTTTTAGQQLYAQLIQLASPFAQISDAVDQVAAAAKAQADAVAAQAEGLQGRIDELMGNTAAIRARELGAIDQSNRSLQERIYQLQDEAAAAKAVEAQSAVLLDAVSAARSDLISAYDDEVSALDSTVSRFRSFAADLRKFRDSLTLGGLSPYTPGEKYAEAGRQLDTTYAAMMAGDETAVSQIQSVAQAFLDASQTYNASSDAYVADFTRVQQMLSNSAISAYATADVAKVQLDVARSQLDLLGQIDAGTKSVAQAMQALSAAVLQAAAAGQNPGRDTIGALTGGATDSWVQAAAGLQVWQSLGGATASRTAQGTMLYGLDGKAHTSAELIGLWNSGISERQIYDSAKAMGITLAELEDYMGWPRGTATRWAQDQGLPAFANGGLHQGGFRIVGERGWEVEATGPARYWTFEQSKQMLSGGGADVAAEIRALRAEVQMLREQQRDETSDLIASHYDAASRNANLVTAARSRDEWSRATRQALS